MSAPLSNPADVEKMIEVMKAAALSSCNFTPGVVGTGKPLAVAEKPTTNAKPKMRTGPTLGPRKAAKVSDIF
jgi:hypothetical protein